MNTKADLLAEIECFLKENPTLSVTRFGLEAANDGKIIPRLKAGKDITLRKADAIRSYISEKTVNSQHTAA
jgi:hypothetical protein